MNAPVLMKADLQRPFLFATDARKTYIGEVLNQIHPHRGRNSRVLLKEALYIRDSVLCF